MRNLPELQTNEQTKKYIDAQRVVDFTKHYLKHAPPIMRFKVGPHRKKKGEQKERINGNQNGGFALVVPFEQPKRAVLLAEWQSGSQPSFTSNTSSFSGGTVDFTRSTQASRENILSFGLSSLPSDMKQNEAKRDQTHSWSVVKVCSPHKANVLKFS